jgi:hypothetical protein
MISRRHALISLTALGVVACASPAQKAVEQATGVQTSQKGDTVQIKGQDGTTLSVSSQLPDDLKNFPVPPGFKPDSSSTGSMSAGGDKLAVASWKGTGTLDSVAAFYKTAMPAQGWTEVSTLSTDSGGLLIYSKGDQNGLTITTSKDADGVTISVLLGHNAATATPTP